MKKLLLLFFFFFNYVYAQVPAKGLIAYYPFNGNANDESNNGNNGTETGGVTYVADRLNQPGAALELNGSAQYVSLPGSIFIDTSFTISFWILTTVSDPGDWPYGMFIIDRDLCYLYEDWSIELGLGGKIQFNTGTTSADAPLTTNADVNTSNCWTHVVVVRDAFQLIKKIYVNGQLDISSASDGQPFTNNSITIDIGASNCNGFQHTYYQGKIDDIRIYNRALDSLQIDSLYHEGGYSSIPVAGTVTANPDTLCVGGTALLTVTGNSGTVQWQSSSDGVLFSDIPGSTSLTYTTPAIIQSTYYRVTARNSCDTVTSADVAIQISPAVIAGIINATKDTICAGTLAHLILQGSSGGTLLWQSSDTTFDFSNINDSVVNYNSGPLNNNIYYRVVVTNGTCADTTNSKLITVIPAPQAFFSDTVTNLTVQFNSDSSIDATTFYWDFGDTTNSSEHNPIHIYGQAGTYHVCLTVKNNSNCNFTLCQNIIISFTGISKINGFGTWQVFPNPVEDKFYINASSKNTEITSLEVSDMLGRNIDRIIPDLSHILPLTIDASAWPRGMYYVKIRTAEGSYVRNVLKQ